MSKQTLSKPLATCNVWLRYSTRSLTPPHPDDHLSEAVSKQTLSKFLATCNVWLRFSTRSLTPPHPDDHLTSDTDCAKLCNMICCWQKLF